MTLTETRNNNILMGCLGLNFVNPAFRKLTGQLPYEVDSYTIYGQDDKKKEKRFKKLLEKNERSFVVIVRGEKSTLDEVLFVPSKKYRISNGLQLTIEMKAEKSLR